MKTFFKILVLLLLLTNNTSFSQIKIDTVFINDKQSLDDFIDVRYYFYPNLLAYYDTKIGMFIYKQNGEWIKSEIMSFNLRGYSLKNNSYVLIKGYIDEEPYKFIEQHKKDYPADFSTKRKQKIIASN